MMNELERSYRHCRRVARGRARNFYYGFWLLPKPRRDALCAVYAFMRYCDDVADGPDSAGEKADGLRQWRAALDGAVRGEYQDNLILPAFHDAVRRFEIPVELFHDLIDGAEMDLSLRSYRTFEQLYEYCYRVASVVGLCSLHVFGFRDERAKALAEQCGIAFQLTNILRDLQEDAREGRVYLPQEDLDRFGYGSRELEAGVRNTAFRELMSFEIARARSYYQSSYPLLDLVEEESRPALWTLISIYRGILSVIERNGGDVFTRRAMMTDMEKIMLVLKAIGMRIQLRLGGGAEGEMPWRLDA